MQTPKAKTVLQNVNELTEKFKDYLQLLFDDWKHAAPITIHEKIKHPLFTINVDKTISMNFAKEVIYFIVHYLYLVHSCIHIIQFIRFVYQ